MHYLKATGQYNVGITVCAIVILVNITADNLDTGCFFCSCEYTVTGISGSDKNDIAAFCNLNRSYLGKIFRESMNQTLQQFLIYYRMNRATELLKFTEMSVNEVGRLVGYPNQLHFSRAFKNVFGISPNSWRKENKLVQIPNK